ncbi:hypothetical protein J2X61_002197 [Bacillus sp. 3255]|nr:hypothetical protein [Bacillus sp. 3255]
MTDKYTFFFQLIVQVWSIITYTGQYNSDIPGISQRKHGGPNSFPLRAKTHQLNAIGLHTLDKYNEGL